MTVIRNLIIDISDDWRKIIMYIPYDMKDTVKKQLVIKWSKANKYWWMHFSPTNVRALNTCLPKAMRSRAFNDCCDNFKNLIWVKRKEKIQELAKIKETTYEYLSGFFKDWPKFVLPPYQHQLKMMAGIVQIPKLALFSDCGTGKTFGVIGAVEYLLSKKTISNCMVISPATIMKNAWSNDILKFTANGSFSRNFSILWSYAMKKRLKILEENSSLWVCNYEIFTRKNWIDAIKKRFPSGLDMLVFDESSKLKNKEAKTYKALSKIAQDCKRIVLLSGTPAPNGAMDLWSQVKLLDDYTLEPDMLDYKRKYFYQINFSKDPNNWQCDWRLRSGSDVLINKQLQEVSLRFKLDDCSDVPPQQHIILDVEMSEKQLSLYNEMKDNLYIEFKDEECSVEHMLVKMMKLRQLTSGFFISDEGEVVPIMDPDDNPKIQLLDDKLEVMTPTDKVVIWSNFRHETLMLMARYGKKYGALGIYGGVSLKNKNKALDTFINDPKCKALICNIEAASHGLTMVVSRYSIYFSLDYNLANVLQSRYRIRRHGQTRKTVCYYILSKGTLDEYIYNNIKTKEKLQDKLISQSAGWSRSKLMSFWGK